MRLSGFLTLVGSLLYFDAHAACSSPAGVPGQILWTSNDYKYCADTEWVSMAGTVGGACTSGGKLELSGNDLRFCSSNTGNWTLLKKTTSGGVCSAPGKIEYVSASKSLRWCSSTTWYEIDAPPALIRPDPISWPNVVGPACSTGISSSTQTFTGLSAPIRIRLTGTYCTASYLYTYSKNGGPLQYCDTTAGKSVEFEVANGDTLSFTVMQSSWVGNFNITVQNLNDSGATLDTWNASSPHDGAFCE